MADQDRIDTLTANCWANLYRVDGQVAREDAMEVIYNADNFPALHPLIMGYLQRTDDRDALAGMIADTLADLVRDEFRGEVQQILAAEEEEQACWQSCGMSCAEAEARDRMLDDPRREEPTRIGGGVA